VRRHAESDDLVLLAVLLEFERVIALVAVNNEQVIASYSPPLCVRIKVLQPLKTKRICCPAILRDCNNPIVR
jgi:hypothetical protein